MSIKEYKAHRAGLNKNTKEYKEYLAIHKSEGDEWYVASKAVMEYLNPGEKLTATDYKEINSLRTWYKENEEER